MGNDNNWDNATWEGNRKQQLRESLKLSYQQRFEALETMSETSDWLANGKKLDRGATRRSGLTSKDGGNAKDPRE